MGTRGGKQVVPDFEPVKKKPRGRPPLSRSAGPGTEAKFSMVDVAMRLFGERGYTGTTMRDIANEVGLLAGSLYAHINSKEALLVDIIDAGIMSFLAAIEPHVRGEQSAKQRLRAMIQAHIRVVSANPQRSLVVFHQWRFLSEPHKAAAIEKRRRYERAFIQVVEDGVRAGEFRAALNARITVLTILGALNWTPEWYSPSGALSADELGDTMADTLLGGVCSQGGALKSAKVAARPAAPRVRKA